MTLNKKYVTKIYESDIGESQIIIMIYKNFLKKKPKPLMDKGFRQCVQFHLGHKFAQNLITSAKYLIFYFYKKSEAERGRTCEKPTIYHAFTDFIIYLNTAYLFPLKKKCNDWHRCIFHTCASDISQKNFIVAVNLRH